MRLALLYVLISVACSSTVYGMEREDVLNKVRQWLASPPTEEEHRLAYQGKDEVPGCVSVEDDSDVPCLQRLYECWTSGSSTKQLGSDVPQKKLARRSFSEGGKRKKKKKKKSSTNGSSSSSQGASADTISMPPGGRRAAKASEDERLLEMACKANQASTALRQRLMTDIRYAETVLNGFRRKYESVAQKSKTDLYYVQETYEGGSLYILCDTVVWYLFGEKNQTIDLHNLFMPKELRHAWSYLQERAERHGLPTICPIPFEETCVYAFSSSRERNRRVLFSSLMAIVYGNGDPATADYHIEQLKALGSRMYGKPSAQTKKSRSPIKQ